MVGRENGVIMIKPEDMIAVEFNVTREYRWVGTASAFAGVAGLTMEQVTDIVEGYETEGFDWEPSESQLSTMSDHSDADLVSEEWDWSEVYQD